MKATAVAPSNIAFIKYWGKADDILRLPLNDSISMNLSGAHTTTTVEFSKKYTHDSVYFLPEHLDKTLLKRGFVKMGKFEEKRVIEYLNRMRVYLDISQKAKIVTQNSFPKGAGVASSASGFAALTVAGFAAAGTKLSEKELTIFARMGSGSACRSIPDGFVMWEKGLPAGRQGNSSDSSCAYSLHPHDYWDLRDILVIVDSGMKKVSTTEGMESIQTSPLLPKRLEAVDERIRKCKDALKQKNLTRLGEVMEEDCLDMHAVMQTQVPPLHYWNDTTKVIMDAVVNWRNEGLSVYFTIDAGPNVHILCEGKDEAKVLERAKLIPGIESIILNRPAPGAHLIETHLL